MSSVYPFLFAAGVLACLLWLAATGPARQRTSAIDAALAALAGGLLGARAVYVAAHLSLYAERPMEALFFWQGGLSWVGGAIGGAIGLAVYARVTHQPLWPLADALAPPAGFLSLASWVGCWAEACAYGRRAEAGWMTPASSDLFGLVAPRWPTQALGVACSLGTLGLLVWLRRQRLSAGLVACLTLLLIATAALGISFLRGDPVPDIFGLRLEAVGAGMVAAVAALASAWRARRGQPA